MSATPRWAFVEPFGPGGSLPKPQLTTEAEGGPEGTSSHLSTLDTSVVLGACRHHMLPAGTASVYHGNTRYRSSIWVDTVFHALILRVWG